MAKLGLGVILGWTTANLCLAGLLHSYRDLPVNERWVEVEASVSAFAWLGFSWVVVAGLLFLAVEVSNRRRFRRRMEPLRRLGE